MERLPLGRDVPLILLALTRRGNENGLAHTRTYHYYVYRSIFSFTTHLGDIMKRREPCSKWRERMGSLLEKQLLAGNISMDMNELYSSTSIGVLEYFCAVFCVET